MIMPTPSLPIKQPTISTRTTPHSRCARTTVCWEICTWTRNPITFRKLEDVMNEHEYWNELGNLYFISGAYEPAIHAYARSIELERGFGRAYSNMALAFVQTGQYSDAIDLYHRSIELLSDPREKAITWN